MAPTIVVPVDGSAESEQALVTAKVMAKASGAKLVLLRATLVSISADQTPNDAQEKAIHEVDTYLTALANQLKQEDIEVETSAPGLSPAEGIVLEESLDWADLVVMCAQGHTVREKRSIGPVAEMVLADSSVPVLFVKATSSVEELQMGSKSSPLLVPLDGSEFAETALPHAVAISHYLDRDIVLLRVVETLIFPKSIAGLRGPAIIPTGESFLQKEMQSAADYLDQVMDSLDIKNRQVQTIVRHGQPAKVIQEECQARKAGMIVMATHGSTGLKEVLMGSVATEQVHMSSIPTYIVPPGELVKTNSGILDTRQPDLLRL